MFWSFQPGVSGTISILSSFLSPSTTTGESSPPRSMTLGTSSLALPTRAIARAPKPTLRTGKSKSGTSIVEMTVRRSRTASVSSLRYTMPTLRRDMSVGLLGDVVGRDDFDEDFFEVVLGVLIAELSEGAFNKEFARLDDADGVAEFFDFAHDVGGEDNGFAVVAAFADEGGDGAGGHDVEAVGGLIENHDGRIVDEGTGDGGLLHHAGGELVAAAVAETVHVQAVENVVDALFQGGFV